MKYPKGMPIMMLANLFEKFIWKSRLFITLAVISGILAAIVMVVLGFVTVIWDISHFASVFTSNATDAQFDAIQKMLTMNAVSAMDSFLIATVLFVFSIGLYELFIRKIPEADGTEHPELIVTSFDQLKDKLVKVILIVLFVTFFKCAISIEYTKIADLLYLAISILLIACAMFLGQFRTRSNHHP